MYLPIKITIIIMARHEANVLKILPIILFCTASKECLLFPVILPSILNNAQQFYQSQKTNQRLEGHYPADHQMRILK